MNVLLWGLVGFAISVPLVILTLLVIGLCSAAGRRPPQNTAPAPETPTPAREQARTRNCSVPFCDDPVQVHIHVGVGDTWPFCITHGLPYLQEDFAS